MMRYNPTLAFAPLAEQEKYQNEALIHTLKYVAERSPYYKRIFEEQKIDIAAVKSVHDLKFLPTTTKNDIQHHNWEFLCVSDKEIREYTSTSGTMGRPVTIALTENDLQRLAQNEQQSFTCAGYEEGDIYQLMLTLDRQFMAGMAYYSGIRQLGAAVIRSGPGMPGNQLDTIMRLQTTGIVSVPTFILKLIEYAREHKVDTAMLPVRKAICIGENIRTADFELNALGEKICSDWPIKLYGTYASTEMQTAFTECSEGRGGHQQPDLVLLEILNDHNDVLKAGEYGEVTITTLGVEGMPLIRYRTGDICAYYDEPCACGRHSRRLSPVLGRKQQMIKYKGTTLYPPAIFEILNELSIVKEYQVEVYTNELGTDEIRLHINTPLPVDDCELILKPKLQAKLRVAPQLQFHSAAKLHELQFPEGSRKQVKFVDNRNLIEN